MATLLVQSCSKSKNEVSGKAHALDVYSGYFFKIIKKAMREDELCPDMDVCILSAEYGLIDAETEIKWYDRRMDRQRARELVSDVTSDLHERVVDNYDRVIVNVGEVYKKAIDDGLSTLDVDVYYIQGEGIGVKGSRLKGLIRGEIGMESPRIDTITESL